MSPLSQMTPVNPELEMTSLERREDGSGHRKSMGIDSNGIFPPLNPARRLPQDFPFSGHRERGRKRLLERRREIFIISARLHRFNRLPQPAGSVRLGRVFRSHRSESPLLDSCAMTNRWGASACHCVKVDQVSESSRKSTAGKNRLCSHEPNRYSQMSQSMPLIAVEDKDGLCCPKYTDPN